MGIRYYKGTVHRGEHVRLAREPTNLYDANAIRVDNILNEQVGHIQKDMAKIFSPFIDLIRSLNLSNHLSFEAIVTREAGSYTIPLLLRIYSAHSYANLILSYLKKYGITPIDERSVEKLKLPKNAVKKTAKSTPFSMQPIFGVNTKNISNVVNEIENNFDQLFKDVVKHDQLQLDDQPKFLITQLKTHQRQGLFWMKNKEKQVVITTIPSANSLYWHRLPNGKYYNTVSRTEVVSNPSIHFPLGGIIADGSFLLIIFIFINYLIYYFLDLFIILYYYFHFIKL